MTRVKDDDQNQRKNDIGIFNGDFDHSKFTDDDDDDNMMLFWLFLGGVFLAWCSDYYDTTGNGNDKEDNEQEEYCIKVEFVYSVEDCDYVNDTANLGTIFKDHFTWCCFELLWMEWTSCSS